MREGGAVGGWVGGRWLNGNVTVAFPTDMWGHLEAWYKSSVYGEENK